MNISYIDIGCNHRATQVHLITALRCLSETAKVLGQPIIAFLFFQLNVMSM